MTALDDELSALRHDEGCSAAFGDDLRCRCRLEARRGEAREELAKLRASIPAPASAPTPAAQLHAAVTAKRDAERRLGDLFDERWPGGWPFDDFHAERDSVYDCSIEFDGCAAVPSREDVEFVLGLGFEKAYFNRNGSNGREDPPLTRCFSKGSDYDATIAWYRARDGVPA